MSADLLNTALTRDAGIDVPLIGGAMFPCGNPELVAAVAAEEPGAEVGLPPVVCGEHPIGGAAEVVDSIGGTRGGAKGGKYVPE